MTCQKCGVASGGDWGQCAGACPEPGSPYYDRDHAAFYAVTKVRPQEASVFILTAGGRFAEPPSEVVSVYGSLASARCRALALVDAHRARQMQKLSEHRTRGEDHVVDLLEEVRPGLWLSAERFLRIEHHRILQ